MFQPDRLVNVDASVCTIVQDADDAVGEFDGDAFRLYILGKWAAQSIVNFCGFAPVTIFFQRLRQFTVTQRNDFTE